MSKKISIILISLVILVSLAISIYIPNRKKIDIEDQSIKYSTIEKDGKIGVIDQNQNIIIEPKYSKVIIINPHRAVFVCQNENEQKVVNNKNQEIFKQYDKIEPIEIYDEKYERNILKYEKDGKYGLLGITGYEITKNEYEEILGFGNKDGELLTKVDGKYGILDSNGNWKIKNKYDEIQSDGYYTDENEYKKSGYIVKTTTPEGYRYGYYDNEGGQVLNEEYNNINRVTQIKGDSIYLMVEKNGQSGVFVNNTKIINTEYQSIEYNSERQIFIVERTGKFGAISLKGTKILETEYSQISINGIYLYSVKDEIQKVFDENGNEVNISFDTVVMNTPNSKYFIRNDAGNYSIVDENLEKLTKQNYRFIEYAYENYFIATNEQDKIGMIDFEEKIVVGFEYDLIQIIKDKNIIQAVDFSINQTDIYDNQFDLALEMTGANIQLLDDGIKIYNEEKEVLLDNNGKIITK